MTDKKRQVKDLLYEQVSRIGKAVSSPKRLELLELLAQGEKTVEVLAKELSIEVKLTSAHLKALKAARLVDYRRDGKYMVYRLSGDDVSRLWVSLREVAEEHLVELQLAVQDMVTVPDQLVQASRKELLAQAKRGEVIVLDVRPEEEYAVAHLPFARSMPVAEIARRLAELPKGTEIVAYCRGPFCLFSEEAQQLLTRKGYRVRKLLDGVAEWSAAGMPLEHAGGT